MGKLVWLHRQRWKDSRDIRFAEYVRLLKKENKETLEDLAIFRFGSDGAKAKRNTRELLKRIYLDILEYEVRVLVTNPFILRECDDCGYTYWGHIEGIVCPKCNHPHWRRKDFKFFYYITTEASDINSVIIDRRLKAWNSEAVRYMGDDEHPNVYRNLITLCPRFGQLSSAPLPALRETAKQLLPGMVTCPSCGKRVPDGKLCNECGIKLH